VTSIRKRLLANSGLSLEKGPRQRGTAGGGEEGGVVRTFRRRNAPGRGLSHD